MIWIILLSILSAILYRLGGSSTAERFKWWPVPDLPKERDVGCSLCALAGMAIVGISAPWWTWLISFGLMWGALSTYWQFLFNGKDNHYAHGVGLGVALAPVMFFDEPLALGVRIAVIGILMGVYSGIVGNATREELGRGFLIPITLALVWIL